MNAVGYAPVRLVRVVRGFVARSFRGLQHLARRRHQARREAELAPEQLQFLQVVRHDELRLRIRRRLQRLGADVGVAVAGLRPPNCRPSRNGASQGFFPSAKRRRSA